MGFQGTPDQPYRPPQQSGGSSAFGSGFSGCLGVGCAIMAVIVVLLVVMVACVSAIA